ncbi:hypothetical protein EPUS_04256 [Endocarpon pusillum Z07020]|uniref:CorA-like transporter domain-containing protein n=1 Tax=Endocarpon pusillum (strain Z07020 / HMAS-L-300199) TaxID=1263415 RepID=U1GLP2_ENDPU|nr:uncharacterized protein EPUS_04256 [Endocarpon pusillum Z07020]ERF72821.1 hypothetical protein EPUS_04256 [Endocarpon pusillum Z07020]
MSNFAEASSKLFLNPGVVEPGIEVLLSTPARCKKDSLDPILKKTIEPPSDLSRNTREKRAEVQEQWDDSGLPSLTKRPETESQWMVLNEASGILSLLSAMFGSLLREAQIPSSFRNILLYFGRRDFEVEIVPPRFQNWPLGGPDSSQRRGFECMYGLRFVEQNERNTNRPWSLRQTAVYHRYDAPGTTATCIFVAMSPVAKELLSQQVADCQKPEDINPFAPHVLLLSFAAANWRHYLVHLTTVAEKHSQRVLLANGEGVGPVDYTHCGARQLIKILQDDLLDVSLVLSSTIDTVEQLLECCQENEQFQRPAHYADTKCHLRRKRGDLVALQKQADHLRLKVRGTDKLVASFLDLGNGFALRELGHDAREETEEIHKLTESSAQDAAAVKLLTMIMLIYLPATVVSSFFSTAFVDADRSPGRPGKLVILENWWIYVAAAVPLTFLTFFLWWSMGRVSPNVWCACLSGVRRIHRRNCNEENPRSLEEGT